MGIIYDSGFVSFGRSLLPWLGVSVNEAMIRNLSLTLGNITNTIAKAIAAQQKFLGSLAKVVLVNRIVFNYLLAEQGSVCTIVNTLVLGLTLLREWRYNYLKYENKPIGYKSKPTHLRIVIYSTGYQQDWAHSLDLQYSFGLSICHFILCCNF